MTAGRIISRAREEMKLPLFKLMVLFKISLLFIWQIETRLWRRFLFFFLRGGGGVDTEGKSVSLYACFRRIFTQGNGVSTKFIIII